MKSGKICGLQVGYISEGTLIHEGRVGVDINLEQAQACALQCGLNLLAQVKAASEV